MRNKKSFIICAMFIILSNILMISLFNNGEEIGSNLFVVAVTLFLLPMFLSAADNKQTSLIRLESSALIIMASLSVMRLINRIDTMSDTVNSLMSLVVLGMGVMLITASILRIYKNRKK